jgi:3-hydroxymyristoyl/3-hydroxydecanoyl-(acyl carrier protein) dehydratase
VGERRVGLVLASANGFLGRDEPWPITFVAEALAQSILVVFPPRHESEPRLVGLHKVALRRGVVAGDRLEVEVEELGSFGALRKYGCRALCGGALAATAEVTVAS